MVKETTDGVLTRDIRIVAVKDGIISFKIDKEYFPSTHAFIAWVQSREQYIIGQAGEIEGFKFFTLTVAGKSDPGLLMLTVFREALPKKITETLWTSGICSPTKKFMEEQGLDPDSCIWEGVMKMPENFSTEALKENIIKIDKGYDILHDVIINKVDIVKL